VSRQKCSMCRVNACTRHDEESGFGSGTLYEGAMTALPSKHSSGRHLATEEEDDHRTGMGELEKMWRAGYKYSWMKMEAAAQNRAEDGEEWSVAYVLPGV